MKRLLRFVIALLLLALAGELIARLAGAEPAYARAGRIRRACGCRTLHITHAPPGMDTSVHYCINRLGLRGDLPEDGAVRIITMGNSTTECAYIDDAAAWPQLLKGRLDSSGRDVWVGNAGVNGSSTRGNAIFLEDHLVSLKPDLVLFMPGAADRGQISVKQDAGLIAPAQRSPSQWFMENSVLVGSIVRRYQERQPRVLDWSRFDRPASSPDSTRLRGSRVPLMEHGTYVEAYYERIAHIADLCAGQNVRLLLMTQPILAPDSSDAHRIMELYNAATIALAKERGLPVFDLASALAQDKRFYLDGIHFSNTGAKEVARLVTPFVQEELSHSGI